MSQYIKHLTKQIEDVNNQITQLDTERVKLVKKQQSLQSMIRERSPAVNQITGKMMYPDDCTCRFNGTCLSFCNPYK